MINLMMLIMLWIITLIIAALFGYITAKKQKKTAPEPKEPTTAEKRAMEKAQREYENFMSYTGKPQDRIDTE